MAAPFLLEPAGGGAWLLNEINNITTSEYPDFLKLPYAVSGLYYPLMIYTVMHSIVGAFTILCRACRIRGPPQKRGLRGLPDKGICLTKCVSCFRKYFLEYDNPTKNEREMSTIRTEKVRKEDEMLVFRTGRTAFFRDDNRLSNMKIS